MSADIANWLQVNIVNNPQVLKSLIALIILIVAYFLFSEKPTEKNPFRRRRVWGAILFVFGMFVFLFAYIADLADVFTVWATLVLVGVAVFSFEESRRLRKQYKEREERDRKERYLEKIVSWAKDILNCGRERLEWDRALKDPYIFSRTVAIDLNMSYTTLRERGRQMVVLSAGIDNDLGSIVADVQRKLSETITTTYRVSKEEDKPESIKKFREELDEKANEVVKKATDLQLELITQ